MLAPAGRGRKKMRRIRKIAHTTHVAMDEFKLQSSRWILIANGLLQVKCLSPSAFIDLHASNACVGVQPNERAETPESRAHIQEGAPFIQWIRFWPLDE